MKDIGLEMVTSKEQELQMRIDWLELGLKKIIEHSLDEIIKEMAQAYLDGEPTTADEYNESQIQESQELMEEFGKIVKE